MNYAVMAVAVKPRISNQRARKRQIKADYDRLLKQALSQPGVADYMEVLYAQHEYNSVLAALSNMRARRAITTNAAVSIPYPVTP